LLDLLFKVGSTFFCVWILVCGLKKVSIIFSCQTIAIAAQNKNGVDFWNQRRKLERIKTTRYYYKEIK
jgi:hypothetical protein